jgi:hypothetical protein
MFPLSLLYYVLVHFKFCCENYRGCKDISCEQPQFCSKFLSNLYFENLKTLSWFLNRSGVGTGETENCGGLFGEVHWRLFSMCLTQTDT